ncbi:MAG: methyltransferase domain-containing protein [Mariprofundales bacterium]|nr:methyltransferase domain-containing protein [Mariprofundales bacterium]
MSMQSSVLERYSEGAEQRQEALCCPVDYDPALLKMLPQEIIDKDYGCGDPSRYVQAGDTVLDLGSGGGKICYMAAQLVGDEGLVIGIDMNDDMLDLARRHQAAMAAKIGGDRVRFLKGQIQDLAINLEAMDSWLAEHPVHTSRDLAALHTFERQQKLKAPLIENASIDLIISNCVLNLVDAHQKEGMFSDMFRVLKPGGRVAISDIVSDEVVSAELMADPELWSGCISGAMEESALIEAFAAAGFTGIRIDKWESAPWQIVGDIEFRSVTITAVKPISCCLRDQGHAVVYRGPFPEAIDDNGNRYLRGHRIAVSAQCFKRLMQPPYADAFIGITPAQPQIEEPWNHPAGTLRPSSSSKRAAHQGEVGKTGGCC